MGMYTEFIFGCSLKKETPKVCIDALDYVINGAEKKPKYENPLTYAEKKFNLNYIERTTPIEELRAFIDLYNLERLLLSCSYYFDAPPVKKFYFDDIDKCYHISTRSDLKNYTNQIDTFIDYIRPYIDGGSGTRDVFAYVMYEEQAFPTIYALDGTYDVNRYIKDEDDD